MGVFGNTFGKLYSYSEVTVPEVPEVNTIYIDFDSVTDGVGTLEDPKNTYVGLTLLNDYTYKAKCGTSITTATTLLVSGKSNITFTTYDIGDKPKLIVTTSGDSSRCITITGCNNISLIGWDISGNHPNGIGAGIRPESSTNVLIQDCEIHDILSILDSSGWGVRAQNAVGLRVLNCYIHHVGNDGFYCRESSQNLEIGYCYFEYVNLTEPLNPGANLGGGDCIQLNGRYEGFHIHHNTLDRNVDNVGNKYCMLISQGGGNALDSGIIEYNTFRANSVVSGVLYLSNVLNTIVRYNTFEGNGGAASYSDGTLKVAGGNCVNTLIYNNKFYDITGRAIVLGYLYPKPGGYGASIGTKIYNNDFYNIAIGDNLLVPGACIWNDSTEVTVTNNIFHLNGNTATAFYNGGAGTVWHIANNSFDEVGLIGVAGKGTNSVIGNPLFVDAPNKDFHLQSTSPCIDKGANVNIIKDFDGINIPQGVAPDIGAYEFI